MSEDEYTLWPGSRAARDAGCTCPVLDNGYGDVELARDRGGWWMFTDCSVHGPEPAPIPAHPGARQVVDTDDPPESGWGILRGER